MWPIVGCFYLVLLSIRRRYLDEGNRCVSHVTFFDIFHGICIRALLIRVWYETISISTHLMKSERPNRFLETARKRDEIRTPTTCTRAGHYDIVLNTCIPVRWCMVYIHDQTTTTPYTLLCACVVCTRAGGLSRAQPGGAISFLFTLDQPSSSPIRVYTRSLRSAGVWAGQIKHCTHSIATSPSL